MTQAISIEKLTLSDVEDQLSLQMSTDKRIFQEWQSDLLELTEFEIARVERIKAVYQNMERDIALRSSVNMAIVGPYPPGFDAYRSRAKDTAGRLWHGHKRKKLCVRQTQQKGED